ncbi:uncharacterized protein LOC126203674 [Schistocerca nitens]|uniref:uncharacterized protein LOC126203674 n=1 Tax=Schistocerca nitens TaxID=7011 RepID=UPI0021194FF0|nr:uncharacterized protein LOC126203674 [Schistocerca nitens]
MRPHSVLVLLLLLHAMTASLAIMVPSGKLEPITPPDPAPRPLPAFPLVPPAPVYEDPEPHTNLVLPPPPARAYQPPFGFRLKPLPKQRYPLSSTGFAKHLDYIMGY